MTAALPGACTGRRLGNARYCEPPKVRSKVGESAYLRLVKRDQGYNTNAVSVASLVFRDHETSYVVASVSVAWISTVLLLAYEIGIKTTDTKLETTVAVAYGVAAAVGLTLLTVGTFEVIMVLARRREQRLLEQARREKEEVEKRWKAWYDGLPDEVKKNQPPPPDPD